jgi:nicotinamidase-related amidase
VHTARGAQADLSDCPPAKRLRGDPSLRIGDAGPMGRLLIAGEPGTAIIPALAPQAGELVIDKPGKGMFWATGLHEMLQRAASRTSCSPA